eukprot:UN06510
MFSVLCCCLIYYYRSTRKNKREIRTLSSKIDELMTNLSVYVPTKSAPTSNNTPLPSPKQDLPGTATVNSDTTYLNINPMHNVPKTMANTPSHSTNKSNHTCKSAQTLSDGMVNTNIDI